MKKMSYMPGLGLGKNLQGPAQFEEPGTLTRVTGVGYHPSEDKKEKKGDRLEDYFVKEEAKQIYQGQPEPFWDKETNTFLPGFEIFANNVWPESNEELEAVIKPAKTTDWVETLAIGSLVTLFEEDEPLGIAVEAEVQMLGQEAPEDPTSLIMDAARDYKNWTFIPSATSHESEPEAESFESSKSFESSESSESESVPLGPTPQSLYFEFESTRVYGTLEASANDEINESDSAYSPVFEINCVDPNDEEIDFKGEIPEEIRSLIEREDERHAQPVKEEVVSINLRDEGNPRMVQIGSALSEEERQALVELLKEFEHVFAWSHADMPGIDPEIVEHRIPLHPDAKPVKQKLRRMRPDWVLRIKEEVTKQINTGFLMVTKYPQWVANIVPVLKKDGKIRVCVDFRDLNKASPKDDFPLPHIDVLVDNTAGHALLSFMDDFSGYNQILTAPEDREKTTFITEWGTYCYWVMPFGLKNAGSTYQRAAITLLHDMIHR
ncbi:hypothetical protein RHGRI_000971 [Rhododendron griersonianum]|uniref:Reverse transcriptase domain-containing protein n=1 Tax=Rhododendron griersonianum TaxID=479676 RepID=A0AAV6LIJ0_9ERIC|nr:hypothetical protein RHGRI_000971 [Rhododendron griersonianum]